MSERLVVLTGRGLEGALQEEASALGEARAVGGGIELRGPPGLHRAACLRLACADQVWWVLGEVVLDGEGLARRVAALDWGQVWDGRRPVAVEIHVRSPGRGDDGRSGASGAPGAPPPTATRGRREGGALRRTLTDVLAELLRPAAGARGEPLTVHLTVEGSRLRVAVDCAGEPLHRRGWRQEQSRAPLRETLAAGLLRLAGHSGEAAFVDPMCGSGTALIEATLRACRKAPGLQRRFAFEAFPCTRADALAAEREALRRDERAPPGPSIGGDLNAGALGVARRNARRAGVDRVLRLQRGDALAAAPPDGPPGLLFANLPYGRRVDAADGELLALYRGFGRRLRERFAGWRVALLAPADTLLVDALGFEVGARHPVANGGLRCVLLVADLTPGG